MRSQRMLIQLTLCMAVLGTGLTVAPSAAAESYALMVSSSPDRSGPVVLEGATLSGIAYVFVEPASGASRVRFWLDNPSMSGTSTKTENNAPWDFAGTNTNDTARPTDTETWSNASHTIHTLIDTAAGVETISAAFTVSNGSDPPPPPPPSGYQLQVSASPDRSSPAPLEEAAISGTAYVFVDPASGASRVRFWLDNPSMSETPTTTENKAPWDFAGTNSNGTAKPTDTTKWADGSHSIHALIDTPGGPQTISATFTVGNGTGEPPPPPPPSDYQLQVSTSSSRSDPVPLDGSALSGAIHVFVEPSSGPSRVRFWLDNPSMSGTPTKTENGAPWDFAGTASNGSALPTDTRLWSNGSHTIHARVDTASGVETISATFGVSNSGLPDQVHLAWVEDPSATLTVVWRAWHPSTPSEVQYRPVGQTPWATVVGAPRPSGTTGTLHEATIRSLAASTAYEYRVRGDNGTWSDVFTAHTAPSAGPGTFDFVYVADTGLSGRTDGLATGTEQVVEEIAALSPLLVLAGGDYAYYNTDKRYGTLNNTIDAWFNQMAPIATASPLMPTYGNHEVLLSEGFSPWAARFPTPEGLDSRRNYSFDIGDVHFVSILAVHNSQGLTEAQLQWIEEDIEAAQAAGQRWIIPFFHVSPFSDGSAHPSNLELRAQLGSLFEGLDVQLAIASHDQSYERTYPLRDVPATNTRTSSSTTCYTMSDGVTWMKVSPGGKLSNTNGNFSQFKTDPPPSWVAFRDNTMHHFSRVQVFAAGVLRVTTYGVVGDGTPPQVIDTFEYRDGTCPS
ncbi:MAG: purple acid phosphatase family protein [Actinomycetota bacterium]